MDQLDRLVLLKNMFEEDQRKNGKEPLPSLKAAIEGLSIHIISRKAKHLCVWHMSGTISKAHC